MKSLFRSQRRVVVKVDLAVETGDKIDSEID